MKRLHDEYGVRAVVNCIGEYVGPVDKYDDYNIEQLWIPVADYAAVRWLTLIIISTVNITRATFST